MLSRRRLHDFAAFAIPLLVSIGGARYVGSGDTVPAEVLPVSLLEHGTLTFDWFVPAREELPYYFRRIRGHVVSNYPVLPGPLNVPVFAAARLFGVELLPNRMELSLLTASTLSALSVLLLLNCLRRVVQKESTALLFAFAYALTTCVWSVASLGLFQHAPSLFFLTLGLLLLLLERPSATAFCGLALGLAVVTRPTNLCLAVPLAWFVLRNRRSRFPAFAALALVPAALHAWYAAAYWGTPFSAAQIAGGTEGFRGNVLQGLAGLLVSPSRGLFVFSPWLLFAIPGAVAAFRRGSPPVQRALAAGVLLLLAACSLWRPWWGGHSFGYRLILEVVPWMVVLIAAVWPEIRRRLFSRVAFAMCLGFSLFVQYLGARIFPSPFNENIDLETERLWYPLQSELVLDFRTFLRRRGMDVPPNEAELRERTPTPGPRSAFIQSREGDRSISAFLEWPRSGSAVRGPLRIAGWAGSRQGRVQVRIILEPGRRMVAARRTPRPDVCRVAPDFRDCPMVGFVADLTRSSKSPQACVLRVELDGSGGSVRRLDPVPFFWREASP